MIMRAPKRQRWKGPLDEEQGHQTEAAGEAHGPVGVAAVKHLHQSVGRPAEGNEDCIAVYFQYNHQLF